MKKIKILLACEESQAVTFEFRKLGFEAFSCDIRDSTGTLPKYHIKDDLFNVINDNWDCIIAFPPCTYLTYASNGVWSKIDKVYGRINAVKFFMDIYTNKCKYIAIENPQGIMGKFFRQPDQTIHPYYFGDNELKRTCLWLKNLPKLEYQLLPDLFSNTDIKLKPKPKYSYIQKKTGKTKNVYFSNNIEDLQNKNNSFVRSKTFPKIAEAMALQWGNFLANNI